MPNQMRNARGHIAAEPAGCNGCRTLNDPSAHAIRPTRQQYGVHDCDAEDGAEDADNAHTRVEKHAIMRDRARNKNEPYHCKLQHHIAAAHLGPSWQTRPGHCVMGGAQSRNKHLAQVELGFVERQGVRICGNDMSCNTLSLHISRATCVPRQ